jgi:flagellar hook-associated protein 3 FlgL
LTTDTVAVTNSALVTGTAFAVNFTYVGPGLGGVTGSATATYDITELPPYAGAAPITSTGNVVPDFPYGSPVTIPVTAIPGVSFNITGTPAQGDSISVSPSATSLFGVLDDAIRNIGSASSSSVASQAVSQALGEIDIGMNRVSAVRGQAGDLLNRADRITSDQSKRSIQMEADRSRAEDLDMVKGISDFQKEQTGYQAALQSYAQVQKLSLFNYIG